MSLIFNIKGNNGDIEINLTMDALNNLEDSDGVLVIPYYNYSYVMTYHPKRKGWEFPSGKRKEKETLLECASRETFEKTGAILMDAEAIGYYANKKNSNFSKITIYIGRVKKFEPKPRWSETDIVKLFNELPDKISYKEDVYRIILNNIKKGKDKR